MAKKIKAENNIDEKKGMYCAFSYKKEKRCVVEQVCVPFVFLSDKAV